jgi:hypothetical protein
MDMGEEIFDTSSFVTQSKDFVGSGMKIPVIKADDLLTVKEVFSLRLFDPNNFLNKLIYKGILTFLRIFE